MHEYVVNGRRDAVNPARTGTKAAPHYTFEVGGGETVVVRAAPHGGGRRRRSARRRIRRRCWRCAGRRPTRSTGASRRSSCPTDVRNVQRQAFAGMLWNKQYYRYDVERWLEGDPGAAAAARRSAGRAATTTWWHLAAADVLSMPDKWEYPWFAAWDTGVPHDSARDDRPRLREGPAHPADCASGTCTRTGRSRRTSGRSATSIRRCTRGRRCASTRSRQRCTAARDRDFLERVFQKLLINFTWWVNRKDAEGNNIFEGGFLGLDNIGVFDRTSGLPAGGRLEQADGTSWMGDVLPQHAGHRARAREAGPGVRGRRDQVLRALRLHRRGDQQDGRPRRRSLGRGGRLLLRRAPAAGRTLHADQGDDDRRG